ncbi:MAG: hypothetical protein EBW52_11225, partial [Betaproteobacteria bacterium]|nr:hypothetical protein [Betaproteobacteria bacterium]
MSQHALNSILSRLRLPVIQAPMAGGVCTVESGASPEHKRLLTGEPGRGTVLTRAFSGRLA